MGTFSEMPNEMLLLVAQSLSSQKDISAPADYIVS